MNANIEAKFKPYDPPAAKDLSAAVVKDPNAAVVDSNAADRTSFRDLLGNSNDEMARSRSAQKNGDATRMAKTDADFAKMMVEKANQANLRKPQNELDKDAFMKLFVTQMRNQDPLNPDNSAQMAAQLAQFHGLEQMMNVNKNLEKMQTENALGRAMGLIGFVGKDIKLENGKLMVEGGKVATEASAKLEHDAVKTVLEVRDSSGVMVAGKDVGPLPAGVHKIEWDGLDNTGRPVGDGAYSFAVVATDVQGNVSNPKITSMVKVTGVDLHDQGGAFYTALGKIGISEVASVGDSGFGKDLKAAAPKDKQPGGIPVEVEGAADAMKVNGVDGAKGAAGVEAAHEAAAMDALKAAAAAGPGTVAVPEGMPAAAVMEALKAAGMTPAPAPAGAPAGARPQPGSGPAQRPQPAAAEPESVPHGLTSPAVPTMPPPPHDGA